MKLRLISIITFLLSLITIFFQVEVYGQVNSPQDCIGAQPICENVIVQPVASNSEGDFPNEVSTNSCLSGGEANSIWYIFTMGTDGNLSFTLEPDNFGDDYDWVLFNITNSSCENLISDPSLLISCNSWGNFGSNGPTGISSSSGGVGSSNGPGTVNGPPFNEDVIVTAGETFVLMVSDWSSTPDGYTLDFSESTAELFDATEPTITNINVSCDNIGITFSENIECSSLDFDDFQLEQNGDIYNVSDISSSCNNGDLFANEILLSFIPEIPNNGLDFTFSILGGFGSVTDMCGNPAPISDTTLVLNLGISMDFEITEAACNTDDGIIEVTNPIGGIAPYSYTLNGSTQLSPIFENLPTGVYDITISDNAGCSATETVTVEGLNGVTYDNGGDGISCELTYPLQASLNTGFVGTWSSLDPLTFSDMNDPNAIVTSTNPGMSIINWTLDNGNGCIIDGSLAVTFTNIQTELNITDALCANQCNGSVIASNSTGGDGSYNCDWTSGIPAANDCEVNGLCPGGYSMTITDGNNCSQQFDFNIDQTSFFAIDSIIGLDESCINYCDGQIEVFAQNGAQYSVDGGLNFSNSSIFNTACNGPHEIIARDVNSCEADGSVFIGHPTPPNANFNALNPSVTWDNPKFEMVNNSENFILNYWQFGYPDELIYSEEMNPIFLSPTIEIGEYKILLVVEDEIGCLDSTIRTVEIRDDILMYVPNAFTPNEDGVNDIFSPVLNDVDPDEYELVIYDRYGNPLFISNNPEEGWNGQTRTRDDFYAPDGVYAWHLNFKSLTTADRIEKKGWISLIR